MTNKTRVAVVYGGRSTEHSISCVSAGAIMANLDPELYDVVPVGITRSGAWTPGSREGLKIEGETLPEVVMGDELTLSLNPATRGQIHNVTTGELYATVDVVFPVLHGPYGEDGTVQGLLELTGLPYVGPGVLASAAGMDKEFTKKLAVAEGLPATPEVILRRGRSELTEAEKATLGLPVFVKPARGGSSIGISKVSDWSELPAAVQLAYDNDTQGDPKVIVEAEIVGSEVEVGVLEYPDGSLRASVPAKLNGIEDSDEGFYGFETKYLDDVVSAQIPADFEPAIIQQLQELAVATFRACDCKGLSRVDFFVTEDGPVLNEINTMPGFTPISMYPQVFAAVDVDYPTLLHTLVQTALAHA
ncbi:D-ala D-ala ligase protein [Corynebacterium sp. CMW7794]|uniref:D-alanine--D-alanine ligase n=1 Tax=Corynebacterium phoceense TaxID=1686286 RepID=A0A540R617_9CORY|nr:MULTISPECIES: D-alanine--D-alanine ligase family protein [Corynebacterium]KXB56742.1 D-ala D-ala ligase protein [Corynebacterium sp. DNF00584]KXI18900.1 D-ala D-ala ligase protein [Corynebacterium sp. CMW7794]MBF9011649.1 D-alanine--D-alanine ligase [Corynebacterium phoceense]MCQ9330004.1 D-alanine--D-alanine ligase [Corynebacterium phoceense]MCQ9349054.1 D-alanine--D-alanine ligase [Corynebacterium phoceense]